MKSPGTLGKNRGLMKTKVGKLGISPDEIFLPKVSSLCNPKVRQGKRKTMKFDVKFRKIQSVAMISSAVNAPYDCAMPVRMVMMALSFSHKANENYQDLQYIAGLDASDIENAFITAGYQILEGDPSDDECLERIIEACNRIHNKAKECRKKFDTPLNKDER